MNSPTLTGEFLAAALAASPERIDAALRVLRGDPAPPIEPRSEPLLSLAEIARALHLHPTTLWRWRVPGHRLAGRPRYRLSEVEAYLVSPAFKERANELRASRQVRKSKETV